jgi:ankyrin repeat protein
VRLLLAAGAPVGALATLAAGVASVAPLMHAAWRAVPESVQLLLGVGAGVNACNEQGRTALMYSVCSPSTNTAAVLGVVEALLAAGAAVNARDMAGNAPLHHLTICSHDKPWAAAAARLLLASGADGRINNGNGQTPAQALPATARNGELHRLLLSACRPRGGRNRRARAAAAIGPRS